MEKRSYLGAISPLFYNIFNVSLNKKVREKSRECHNHKPQPFPDPKRKRKPTNPNKHKSNKCTKSTKISSLFPKRGNRSTKRTEKHKYKMTHGKTYNKLTLRVQLHIYLLNVVLRIIFPQFCKSDMSRFGYLEVFQRVPWNSRQRESTVDCKIMTDPREQWTHIEK